MNPPDSPAILPANTPTHLYMSLHVTRHTHIASCVLPQLSDVASELAGRPFFRYVHDPDIVPLLRALSRAARCPLVPVTCQIRWKSPWELRFRRTALRLLLLPDNYTFEISLHRPKDIDLESRRITRIAQVNFIRSWEDESDSEPPSLAHSDSEESREPLEHAVPSISNTLKQLMQQTMPESINDYCSLAIDTVQDLKEQDKIELVKSGMGVVVGLGLDIGKEASWRVWSSVTKKVGFSGYE